MTPNLKTLSGDLVGQLLSTTVNEKNSTLLTALSSNVKFLDVSKLNLNDLKASLSFKDGRVALKPMNLTYQDINTTVGGTHGFDQTMNYDVKFDVPAKYLGTEVTNLLTKLTPADQQKIESVPVTANLTGNFSSPNIKTDMKQATTNLATQIAKMQKEKLINQGTSALTDLFNGTKNNTDGTATTDSTKTTTPKENVKNELKNVIGGFLGGKKKKE
jgi:hypothetical protein